MAIESPSVEKREPVSLLKAITLEAECPLFTACLARSILVNGPSHLCQSFMHGCQAQPSFESKRVQTSSSILD